jgi:hypothetical protein
MSEGRKEAFKPADSSQSPLTCRRFTLLQRPAHLYQPLLGDFPRQVYEYVYTRARVVVVCTTGITPESGIFFLLLKRRDGPEIVVRVVVTDVDTLGHCSLRPSLSPLDRVLQCTYIRLPRWRVSGPCNVRS